jgi:hypothetical protein
MPPKHCRSMPQNHLRSLPTGAAALALLLAGSPQAQLQPTPTRDVDITYEVTRPHQPRIRERVRWLADERLERIDWPDKSVTIFDRNGDEITLLTPATRTYRTLAGAARQSTEPAADAVLSRGGESVVAGQLCVEWSWMEDDESRVLCTTADGVALRLVVDGKTIMEARSVSFGRQNPQLFKTPENYAPALAPEGGAEP